MSSALTWPHPQGLPRRIPSNRLFKTYAFVYAPGPQWIADHPGVQQNLGSHRAYIADLYAQGRVLFGGTFLDDAGGGFGVVRAQSRDEASELLAADPAITEGVMTGVVRRWHAVFNEAVDMRTALAQVRANRCAVEALFEAVDRRDRDGVRAAYAESIAIHEALSLPYGGDHCGLEGSIRHGQAFRATWDPFQAHHARGLDPRIIADGDNVVVLWHHKVENPATSESLELPAVSVYKLENAKITDSRMFHFDTAALLRFLERNAERAAPQVAGGVR
jgi:uncharacterized protein YciI